MCAFAQKRFLVVEISDSAGNPLEGVNVVLTVDQHKVIEKKTTSDAKGRASFWDFPPGDINVACNKEGFLERIYRFRTGESIRDKFAFNMFREDEVLEDLSNQPTISGVLRDTSGNPIPEAKIVVTIEGTPYSKEYTTGPDGSYSVNGLTNNEITLTASKEEYNSQINKVKMRQDPIEVPEFVMMTLDEAYAAQGLERPKEEKLTPEQEAVEIYNLAVDPYQQGNYEMAEKYAKEALSKDPKQSAAMKLLVFSNIKTEDWGEVLTYSEQFLAINPDDTNMIKAAAQAAELTGKTDKISQYKGQLKEKGEISIDDLWNDVVDALNANDDPKATKLIQEVLKMDPEYPHAFFQMGKIKIREFEFEDAIHNLKLFLKYAPKDDQFRAEATELIVTLSE
jgi:tetratricopeptide (TPR) repeat protein